MKIFLSSINIVMILGTHNVFSFKDHKPTPVFAKYLMPGDVLVGGDGKV